MLILARKLNQTLILTLPDGRTVAVKVVELRSQRRQGAIVRLGVEAPRDVPIDRQEVRDRKESEKGAGP